MKEPKNDPNYFIYIKKYNRQYYLDHKYKYHGMNYENKNVPDYVIEKQDYHKQRYLDHKDRYRDVYHKRNIVKADNNIKDKITENIIVYFD